MRAATFILVYLYVVGLGRGEGKAGGQLREFICLVYLFIRNKDNISTYTGKRYCGVSGTYMCIVRIYVH